jgi:pyruvate kinase
MLNFPTPTRAEANEVSNAVLDGVDGFILDTETAEGEYPVNSV